MSVEEGNRIIAEFMEVFFYTGSHCTNSKGEYDGFVTISQEYQKKLGYADHDEFPVSNLNDKLKYHKSWNWLMPVVDKIETLEWYDVGVVVTIKGVSCIIELVSYSDKTVCEYDAHSSHSKIENTWKACVDFIQKYNNQEL